MRYPLVISALAAVALAGCATQSPDQYAKAECKIKPITATSVTDGKHMQSVSPERERMAQMELAHTQYRMQQLREKGLVNNNLEDALNDCYRAEQ
jgi:uncharacterized lipoprotein YbaY